MSDSALSQDEIDALLTGADAPGTAGTGGTEDERQTLQEFLSTTVTAQSSSLSSMTGAEVSIKGPQAGFTARDAFLEQLPDMVTAVKVDFSSGFPGEHLFLIPEAAAKRLAGLMTKEENIALDEMAMSVIGEAVGTIVGTQITALTGKTGNKSIANITPEANNVPKAVAALPGGNFLQAAYDIDLGDGQSHQFWEIFGPGVSGDIARALKPASAQSSAGGRSATGGVMGQPANVRSVQYPSLSPQSTSQEPGNIGLIMDVFMEMTVELGRTRKSIKDILSMGEGTTIELDKLAGEPVDILVNHKLIAKGEVVVIDENFGVRVMEIVSAMDRISDMG
jgi:flagellar motor switch protein FliN/FliY